MGSLEKHTVMVTGAGVGIGSGTALALAQAGATVIVADISPVTGKATADRIGDAGLTAEFVELDVSDESSWTSAVERVTHRHGPITRLVNNAAGRGSRIRGARFLA